MKAIIIKITAALSAVFMILTVGPLSVSAANLEFTENTSINTENYSFIVGLGDDYIANVLEGLGKDKTITVTKGETATVVMNAGEYTSQTYEDVDFASQTSGSYHYGSGNTKTTFYCIATDRSFSLSTGGDITASVTGFGAGSTGNGKYGSNYTSAVSTVFKIDTADIAAGEYQLNLTFKYQMKKGTGLSSNLASWSTVNEYSGIINGIRLIVNDAESIVNTLGGSIRVTNIPGLRFGFNTTAHEEDVEEYGFIYAYKDTKDLYADNAGENGVKMITAENKMTAEGCTGFNLVFTNIPSSAYDTVVSARSYIRINGKYYYSDVCSYCFRDIANAVLADPEIDRNTKNAVTELLNK